MKQVAFEIVISDTQLKAQVAAVKKALASIKGAGVDIKLNVTKAEIEAMRKKIKSTLSTSPITVNIKGTDKLGKNGEDFNKGISKAVVNMQKFLDLMKKSAAESATIRGNLGSSGGNVRSGGINAGSRLGITNNTGAAQLSAFSGFIRGGSSFTSQIGAYASGFGRLGLAIGAPVAAAALLVKGLRDSVVTMTEFGAKQAELAAITGTTRDGISQLTDQAIRLGASMSFTATEITGAQIELAKLGFTQSEILESTEGVARFAIVAGAKIPEAAEAAGAALQSFGLNASEMDRVVSVLGVSTAKSALDFEKLKVGIGTTFATAKTFGLEIEDVTALLGELSNKGLSASVSATATRNILLNLADSGGKLRRTLAGLGVGEVKGLDGIVKALKTLDNAGIDLAQTFELTDKRSVNAFNSFLRGSDSLINMRDSLVDVNGLFKVMEKERLNSLQGELVLFSSATERFNLLLTEGMEPALQGVLSVVNSLINSFSDLLETPIEEGIENQRKEFERLINILTDTNVSYTVRKRIIDELNLKYPDLLKNVKLEDLSNEELIEKLKEVNELYNRKKNFAVGESSVEKLLKREQELIDDQIISLQKRDKLLKQVDRRDELKALGSSRTKEETDELRLLNQALPARTKENLAQRGAFDIPESAEIDAIRAGVARDLRKQFQGSGDISTDDLANLREYRKAFEGGERGQGLNNTLLLLYQIEQKQRDIISSVPLFSDKDFKAGQEGLSEVDKYLKDIDVRLANISNEGRAGGVESKTLQDIQIKLQDRRASLRGKLDTSGLDRRKGDKVVKESPIEGSIDYLEAEYQKLIKEIDATGDEGLRFVLQGKAESFKKQIKQARNELAASLAATDEEILKNDLAAIDRRTSLELEANKERFKELSIQEAQAAVITKQAEYDKLVLEGRFLRERFEQGLDKTGEYYNKLRQIEEKGNEIVESEQDRNLKAFVLNGEKEINIKLETLRKTYKNDEDYAAAKELLYLELEANKIKFNQKANKFISESDKKTLSELEEKIKGINKTLGQPTFAENQEGLANFEFNEAFAGAFSDDKLTKNEIEDLNKLKEKLAFESEKKILENKLTNDKLEKEEKIALQKELNDLILANQQKQFDDKKEKEQKIWDIVGKGLDYAQQISDSIFEYQKAQLESRAESELESIDTIYAARLKAVEGNEAETARVEQEYAAAKKAAEKKYAEERRQLAIKEAIINGALAVIKSFSVDPTGILAIVTGVTTAIQIATIKAQKFARGGYTGDGKGGRPDETGHVPVGVVHDGEYVVPKWQVNKNRSLIASLEKDRLRGYATGGLVGGGGVSMESFAMMADIIAERVAKSVGAAAYQGTAMGSETGSASGLVKVARETNSRNNSKLINTF